MVVSTFFKQQFHPCGRFPIWGAYFADVLLKHQPAFGWANVFLHQKEPKMPALFSNHLPCRLEAPIDLCFVGGEVGWFNCSAWWFWGGSWFGFLRDPRNDETELLLGEIRDFEGLKPPKPQTISWFGGALKPNSSSDAFGISLKAFFKRCIFRWWILCFFFFWVSSVWFFWFRNGKIQASLRDVFQVLSKSGITAEDDLKTSTFFIWVIFVATW